VLSLASDNVYNVLQQPQACAAWFADGERAHHNNSCLQSGIKLANLVVMVKVGVSVVLWQLWHDSLVSGFLPYEQSTQYGTAWWSGALCCIPRLSVPLAIFFRRVASSR